MTTATATDLKVRLREQEAKIVKAEQSYVDIGDALDTIRQGKLYEAAGYSTFDEYGFKVWQYKRGHLYRLIDAAKVAKNLHSEFETIPMRESHTRPFTKFNVNDDASRILWGKVLEKEPDVSRHTAELIESVILDQIPTLKGKNRTKNPSTPAPVLGTGRQNRSIPAAGSGPVSNRITLPQPNYSVAIVANMSEAVARDFGGTVTKDGGNFSVTHTASLHELFEQVEVWIERNDLDAVSLTVSRVSA